MTKLGNSFYGWLMVLPAAALLALFTHIPVVESFVHSFMSTDKPKRPSRFIGFDNYETLIRDPIFWKALTNNMIYALGSVPLSIAIAMVMALFVNDKLAGRGFLRAAYFTPTILPMIAVANIWIFFFTPDYGLLELILRPLSLGGHNFLGSNNTALMAVTLVAIWKESGFFMIFYLAALQQIAPDLKEAAAIEGTSRFTFFRRVTFPLLMPTTLFVLVNALINAFRVVDHIFVMTGGGPNNATSVLLFRIYEVGFKYFDFGLASAMTAVLLCVLGLIALGQFFILDRKVHYQ
jgi:sn-glycerol 3-phosphate transport system permease protein